METLVVRAAPAERTGYCFVLCLFCPPRGSSTKRSIIRGKKQNQKHGWIICADSKKKCFRSISLSLSFSLSLKIDHAVIRPVIIAIIQ